MTYDAAVQMCTHCNCPIAIRNPSGFCDHLYYPEQCEICKNPDNAKLIIKGRIFNHRDGMSELKRFQIENDAKPMTAEAQKEFRSMDALQAYQLGIKDGKVVGFEKALKVVDECNNSLSSGLSHWFCCVQLSKRIRALERDK